MIGDTEADAAVERALAAPFLGVNCGIREEARLLREGAVQVVASRFLPPPVATPELMPRHKRLSTIAVRMKIVSVRVFC